MFLAALIFSQVEPASLPAIPREFRAAWVATVDNIDWPSRKGLPVATQKTEMIRILDLSRKLNLNAIVYQIRPAADAMYESKIEPWSEYLTGAQGSAPKPFYDPLQFTITEAHKRGIEVHVWFNPYRARHPSATGPLDKSHIAKTNPEVVKPYGKLIWMDPGEPLVQRRSAEVMLDVARRYDIDGVHIDDYFYPYPIAGEKFGDDGSYQRYRSKGGKLAKDDWRRKNVDDFVENLYKKLKQTKRNVKFGISPFGIYRPGIPEGIKAGIDQYAELYADADKWFRKGWCDYYAPQLYWAIAQTPQAYPTLLNWWKSRNVKNRHLWVGNFTSRLGQKPNPWRAKEVLDQIKLTRESSPQAGGNIHFSMVSFLKNWDNINQGLMNGPYVDDAFVPASPWLGDKVPKVGKVQSKIYHEEGFELEFGNSEDIRSYAYCVRTSSSEGPKWSKWRRGSDTGVIGRWFASGGRGDQIAVVAFSKTGVASSPLILSVP